jgi:hypothetical protein
MPHYGARMKRLPLVAVTLSALVSAGAARAWEGTAKPLETGKPAVARGEAFMGFPERFNRYYTDPDWKPSATLYVSPDGNGDGTTRAAPMLPANAVAAARPGTMLRFLAGNYEACFELSSANSGTYDEPIVLYGERTEKGAIGAKMTCCKNARETCFNLEHTSYVAIDGFELIGGKYGVRAVGAGYPASEHSRGIATLNCKGRDQDKDPFFSGQSDWAVWEGNVAHGAKEEDGHGIYLSNGGDWNVVRFNETYANASSDFQINPDPANTCTAEGIAVDDPECDAYADEGKGGRGASDYFLVEGNYFHNSEVGPNFTSTRRSVIRNNIFGPQTRHNASFWQETNNPNLGTRENKIVHNLFLTTDRHAVQFVANSSDNEFANNVLVGVAVNDGEITENPTATLMEVDDTVDTNNYRSNIYISGLIEGRTPNETESIREDFSPQWFKAFSVDGSHDPNNLAPTEDAPFVDIGAHEADAATDRNGVQRGEEVDLGPIEIP